MLPEHLKYSEEHEWARVEGGTVVVGITDFAQDQLTDIVFVELPEMGRQVNAGDPIAVVESVKSVSDIYTPVSGEVSEVNSALEDKPELVNDDPYGEGWLFKLKAENPDLSALLDAPAYQKFIDAQDQ